MAGHVDRLGVVDGGIGIAEAGINPRARFEIFDGVVAADAFELLPGFFAGGGVFVEPEEFGFFAVARELQWPRLFRAKAAETERGGTLVVITPRSVRYFEFI